MPLRGINKVLSKKILFEFETDKNFIFKNIFKNLNINKRLEVYELGYKIAPLINAAGRLDDANQIVELFTSKSNNRITKILDNISKLNKQRKLIEKRILDDLDFRKLYNVNGIIFIYKLNIHEGLIGVIASKIKEYFDKPCLVLTN